MRLARFLTFAPRVAAAFRGGEISTEHALLIAELLPQIVDEATRAVAEAELIKLAKEHPPFVLEQLVDQVLLMLGIESSADAAHAKRYGQRGVSLKPTIAGTGSLEGTLTPEVAEKLRLALVAVGKPAGPEDTRTNRQWMHDALGEIADFALANIGRCAYPGCRRRVVDCHHIKWWSAGGKTTLDNAAWLCAFHHWLVHEGGWTLRRNADGSYTWTSPMGINKTAPPPRHPQAA